MEVSQKIEKLEHELNLKKALLAVKVTFEKGTNPSPEVRAEVESLVKSACLAAADQASENLYEKTDRFTSEEFEVLRAMALKILNRKPTPAVDNAPVVTEAPPKAPQNAVMATLLTLDNVHRDYRSKIVSGSQVRIVGKMDGKTAFVEAQDGFRFHVPIDDLEF